LNNYTINKRLWLIGGTTESVTLARAIASLGLSCTVTVTTKDAKALYPRSRKLEVLVGRLDAQQLWQFFQRQQIVAIVDASHPYAVEISQIAMRAADEQQIPYLRFERLAAQGQADNSPVISLDSFDTLLTGNYLHQQRVLLTVGCKALPLFRSWQKQSTLFTRILPTSASLEIAIAAGFKSDRIIALRPPVPAILEKALWCHWNISLVVTKASGVAGGEEVKREVAAELGIPLVVITRPVLEYPQQTSDLAEALAFCRNQVQG